jgi:peroxiredoxin
MSARHAILALALVLPAFSAASIGFDDEVGSDDRPATATDTAVLGQPAPDFELTDTTGKTHKLSDYAGKIVVLEWFNPECPIAKRYHDPEARGYDAAHDMRATFEKLGDDIVWLAINSGAPGNQGAGLEKNQAAIEAFGIPYPVLLDESGDVGRAYQAETTPHMYVITAEGVLAYAGAIDNGNSRANGDENYVVEAVAAVRAGRPCDPAQTAPFGCSVKYGN